MSPPWSSVDLTQDHVHKLESSAHRHSLGPINMTDLCSCLCPFTSDTCADHQAYLSKSPCVDTGLPVRSLCSPTVDHPPEVLTHHHVKMTYLPHSSNLSLAYQTISHVLSSQSLLSIAGINLYQPLPSEEFL